MKVWLESVESDATTYNSAFNPSLGCADLTSLNSIILVRFGAPNARILMFLFKRRPAWEANLFRQS